MRKLLIPILLVVFAASTMPIKVHAAYSFTFYGAYYDNGTFAGAVNCTLWRIDQQPENFELNGSYTTSADQLPAILQVHLPYNETRTIYLIEAGSYYIFVPEEANTYTYYFQILDFVGVTEEGYIETWLNVNGTLRLIERQTLALMNDIPFQMSWSYSYNIAVYHADYGRGWVGTFIAKSKSTHLIGITEDVFPSSIPSTAGITRSCIRYNGTWVQFYYTDTENNTNWVYFAVYPIGSSTPIVSYNTTSEPVSWNYYDLDPSSSYIGKIQIDHNIFGDKSWSWVLAATETYADNPFVILDDLGTFAFPLRYLPPVLLVLAVFLCFTWWNLPMGIIIGYLFAALFTFLGWLPITWDWLLISGSISFIIAIGLAKERESVVF